MQPKRFVYLIFLSFLSFSSLKAQRNYLNFQNPFLSLSIGNSVIDEMLPEGEGYSPLTLLGKVSIWNRGKWTFYGELQLVQAVNGLNQNTDFEVGTNFGFQYLQPLFKRLSLTAAIGSGPHYITLETALQARGFIFSDNFELGFNFDLPEFGSYIITKARFRHISNAGLEEPNKGIDNLFLIFGLGTIF